MVYSYTIVIYDTIQGQYGHSLAVCTICGGSPPPKMKSKILRHWQHRRPHGLHRSPFHRSLVPALWAAGTGKGLLSHIPPSRGGWCRSPSGCCHPEKWRERSWEKGQKPKRYSHKEGRLWGGYTLYLSQQSNGHYITANIHNNPLWKWVNHKHTAEGKWLLRRIMYLLDGVGHAGSLTGMQGYGGCPVSG